MNNTNNKDTTQITSKDFTDDYLTDYASYSILRAIPSAIDGLKNSQRKIIFTKLAHPNNEKVSEIATSIIKKAQYLHGDASGVVANLCKDYTGSNNLPLLKKDGAFGTRFNKEPAASRYISASMNNLVFKDEYNDVLITQEFEGTKIEPKFYIPVVPLILVNGGQGVATGFASNVSPYKLEDVIQAIKDTLDGKDVELVPGYNNFDGTVEVNPEGGFIEKGVLTSETSSKGQTVQTTFTITEIPTSYNLKSYTKVLDKLEEQGLIKYEDKSDSLEDTFLFVVKVQKNARTSADTDKVKSKLLKSLSKPISQNFTLLDENNIPRVFDDVQEVLKYYLEVTLKYTELRRLNSVQKEQHNNDKLMNIMRFIKEVNNGFNINRASDEVKRDLEALDYSNISTLLSLPIGRLQKDEIIKLQAKIDKSLEFINTLESISSKEMYLNDLNELEETIC